MRVSSRSRVSREFTRSQERPRASFSGAEGYRFEPYRAYQSSEQLSETRQRSDSGRGTTAVPPAADSLRSPGTAWNRSTRRCARRAGQAQSPRALRRQLEASRPGSGLLGDALCDGARGGIKSVVRVSPAAPAVSPLLEQLARRATRSSSVWVRRSRTSLPRESDRHKCPKPERS